MGIFAWSWRGFVRFGKKKGFRMVVVGFFLEKGFGESAVSSISSPSRESTSYHGNDAPTT